MATTAGFAEQQHVHSASAKTEAQSSESGVAGSGAAGVLRRVLSEILVNM
jgi:hypothetical protein